MSLLQDRITSMVHAFGDHERKDAVRALARDVGAMEARVAELEAREKQARDDEAWAKANKVVIDSEPVDKCWCAMVVREDGPLIEVPSANGCTIAAAIRALREKMEAKP